MIFHVHKNYFNKFNSVTLENFAIQIASDFSSTVFDNGSISEIVNQLSAIADLNGGNSSYVRYALETAASVLSQLKDNMTSLERTKVQVEVSQLIIDSLSVEALFPAVGNKSNFFSFLLLKDDSLTELISRAQTFSKELFPMLDDPSQFLNFIYKNGTLNRFGEAVALGGQVFGSLQAKNCENYLNYFNFEIT